MENERKDIRTLARHMALANGIKIVGEEPYAENLHVRFCEGQVDSNHSHYDILTQYKMEREGMSSLVYSTDYMRKYILLLLFIVFSVMLFSCVKHNNNVLPNNDIPIVEEKIDISMIKMDDLEVIYNGESHTITPSNLPDGVRISAVGEIYGREVGTYKITYAIYQVSNNQKLGEISANLVIKEDNKTIDISGIVMEDLEVTYDELNHTITPTNLPEGTKAIPKGNIYYGMVGTYQITYKIVLIENNKELGLVSATLTILKAPEPVVEVTYLTVTEALELANQVGEEGTNEKQYVCGVIKKITNANFGEMYITDGVSDLYIYGVYSSDGELRYPELEQRPYSGDKVYLYGYLKTFNGSPEMGASWLQKFEVSEVEIDLEEYEEKTILETRSLDVDSKVIVEGVVAFITKANGGNPNGFYLVDDTSSIYVYDLEIAGRVKVGNLVKVAGTLTHYILESEINNALKFGYQGSIQLQDAIYISSDELEHDYKKDWISKTTIKEIMDTPLDNNITTLIYKVTGIINKVPGTGFVNYYINDLDNKTGSYVYTLCNGSDFSYLDIYDGKICEIYLSALNCKSTNSGTIYRLIPICQEEIDNFSMTDSEIAMFALNYYAKKQFNNEYNADPSLELIKSVSNEFIPFENVEFSYSTNSELIDLVLDEDKVIMHLNEAQEVAKLTITATYKETTASIDIDINIKMLGLPESISVLEAINSEDGTIVTVRGIVMSGTVNQTGFYLNDGTGVIAVRTDSTTIKNIKLGNEIIITGTKTHKVTKPESFVGQILIDNATLDVNLLGENEYDTSTFITDMSYEEILTNIIPDVKVDHTTEVYKVKCYLIRVESYYSTNYYLTDGSSDSSKRIYLYAGSGSQYSSYAVFLNEETLKSEELEITFAIINWNDKNPYRACIISATDGKTTVLNNYNFKN